MENTFIIGLMSGTSLDGVDLVYAEFSGVKKFKILEAETIPYSEYWRLRLKNIASYPRGHKELKSLDVELGRYFGELLLSFINRHKIKKVDLIASHGHTVHHQPEIGYTLQIGSGEEIFSKTNIKTIYNFREQDVLLGGQGAPLVPIGDQLLFSEYDYCLNLGGFSNVSYDENGVRKAFDICPVNTVLNFYANQLGFEYDKNGALSIKGKMNETLFSELNQLTFYQATTPKSLGIEFLQNEVYPILEKYKISERDILRTFVEHIAYQLTNKLKKGTVLITGGGAYHSFLISRIQQLNPSLTLVIPSKEIVEYKEALVFGLLGLLKNEGSINCLASVTGAKKDHASGVICN
ncbi:anhydro-N-acetylmuramic acid kinase [Wenyingzhuangia sp. chi5]|uniref:Anhydro-N-acetylmuramic acid kinase n=1 Tax=Wenyingzhuangia gilva TaxID=3057677 RepID=A0ABT8VNX5_9FLAO|nr:anhydro-N-acetylmuramic acid kinase [Wenyingzhuangia sp. chi5]MDO3693662.1 anhydro-N-acetylmuramic acid kinase [Wenyingzhuangia sp. chi5]